MARLRRATARRKEWPRRLTPYGAKRREPSQPVFIFTKVTKNA